VHKFWQEHIQDLEEFPCDLCDSLEFRKLSLPEKHGIDSQLVQCTNCGLLFLNPRWDAETYNALYRYVYRSEADEKMFAKELEGHLPAATRLLRIAAGFRGCNRWERVLDIGCGYGALLWSARHLYGAEVFGVEPDSNLAMYCNKMFDANVLPKSIEEGIEEFDSKGYKFDLIVCQQSLNHLYHPVKTLKSLKKLLNPDGLIVLEVLDFESYVKIKGQRSQVDHTHYFTLRTLMAALRAAGFMTLFTESDKLLRTQEKIPYFVPNRHIRCVFGPRPAVLKTDWDEASGENEIKLFELLLKETTPSILDLSISMIRRIKNYLMSVLGK